MNRVDQANTDLKADVRRSLRGTQRQVLASTNLILSLLNTLIAYIACYIANNALNQPLSYSLVPFFFFISLEALYARDIEKRILKNYGHNGAFRLAELLILAVLLRVLLLFTGSEGSQWDAFTVQLDTPLQAFFNDESSAAMVLLLCLWGFCLLNLKDMQSIFNLDDNFSWEQIGKEQANLIKTRQAFIQRFLFLGLALLTGMFLSVSTWAGGDRIAITYHGTPPLLIGVMLLYFFLVLLLMSQTQLARLRTRWWLNESSIHPALGKRWLRVSLIFFAVLSLTVILLPTGFGEDLLRFLQIVLLWLGTLAQVLLALLLLPLAMLFPWLNVPTDTAEEVESAPLPTATPEAALERVTPAWLDTAGDIVFWLVLGLVVAFALIQYLRQDRSLLQDIRRLFRAMAEWFTGIWHSLTHSWQKLQIEIKGRQRRRVQGTQTLHDPAPTKTGPANAVIDQPRRRIFALYRSLLQWGAEHGQTRKPHQTPLAYEARLEAVLEETDPRQSLHDLTDRFDEARYSQRTITEAEAEQLANEWQAVQKKIP